MRILVIEDDSRVASFIRSGLSADEFLVDVAHDALPAHAFRSGWRRLISVACWK